MVISVRCTPRSLARKEDEVVEEEEEEQVKDAVLVVDKDESEEAEEPDRMSRVVRVLLLLLLWLLLTGAVFCICQQFLVSNLPGSVALISMRFPWPAATTITSPLLVQFCEVTTVAV